MLSNVTAQLKLKLRICILWTPCLACELRLWMSWYVWCHFNDTHSQSPWHDVWPGIQMALSALASGGMHTSSPMTLAQMRTCRLSETREPRPIRCSLWSCPPLYFLFIFVCPSHTHEDLQLNLSHHEFLLTFTNLNSDLKLWICYRRFLKWLFAAAFLFD